MPALVDGKTEAGGEGIWICAPAMETSRCIRPFNEGDREGLNKAQQKAKKKERGGRFS